MATVDSVPWLTPYTAENLGGLRSASICWISTATPQDTFTMLPLLLVSRYLCRAYKKDLHTVLGHSKWFDSDKHAQLIADTYDTFVVMVTYDYSNVVIRAPSSFQSADAIRAAIPTARLLGMVFSGCGGAGYWDSVDMERARELLGKREYAGVCVSRVG